MQFLTGRRGVPLILQSEQAECGMACLAMVSAYFGRRLSLPTLRRSLGPCPRGMTMAHVADASGMLGLVPRALKCNVRQLTAVATPAILWWNQDHFVVLVRAGRRGIVVNDPAEGELSVSWAAAEALFSGIALELRPIPNADLDVREEQVDRWGWLLREIGDLRSSLIAVVGISLIIELLALGMPLYVQMVVDRVVRTGDLRLHAVIAAGFAALLVTHGAVRLLRGWLMSWMSAALHARWTHLFFAKLISLPIAYFERSSGAEVLSRFGSLRTVQVELSGAAVGTALDGMTSVAVLAVLAFYSPALAVVCIGLLVVFAGLRKVFLRSEASARHEKLVFDARSENEIIESVRGAKAIKLASQEHVRTQRVFGFACDAARRDLRLQRLAISFDVARELLSGGGRLLIVSFGAIAVVGGELTLGMMLAVTAFSDQLLGRGSAFISALYDLKLMKVDLDRVADVTTEPSESISLSTEPRPSRAPEVVLEAVGFRYSERDPWLFRNVDARFPAGQCTAIVAPSGVGKTTLLKIILGLVRPTEGRVLIDGIEVSEFGTRQLRAMCAGVFQDDVLFAGSVAENISFFDPDATTERILSCARAAEIATDIEAMPMGFRTVLGELGAGLSGGQRQRLVLARALYRNPQLLVLDEATSSLDAQAVGRIDSNIRSLASTRIVVSHNRGTVALADQVFELMRYGDPAAARPVQSGAERKVA
jgi:ATP-binding cassette subfamily B protein RaxB